MNHKIYYFSATGNSLQIARLLSTKLGDCTIKSMATPPPNQPVGGSTESIGFAFPVYYFGIPRIVKRFVEKLSIRPETYCFAVTNFGGAQLDTLGMLDDILQKKNIRLSYAAGVTMPDNYIVRYDAVAPDKARKMIDAATGVVDEAAEAILERKVQPVKRKARLLGKMVSRLTLYRDISGYDKKFSANSNCVGCGLCSEICPVSNIKIEAHRPVWQHNCERCMACIHWCPSEAIQYGKKTVGRTRYHNPSIKVKDIAEGNRGIS
jgi:ferredoxin